MRINTLLLILIAAVAGTVVAATYDLGWHTLDGGGQMFSTGGQYSLGGTIGQVDAGPAMSGGRFQVVGGFWTLGGDIPPPTGDCDADGDVDLSDHSAMVSCLGGPAALVETAGCECFDVDGSGTIDLLDVAAFQIAFYP